MKFATRLCYAGQAGVGACSNVVTTNLFRSEGKSNSRKSHKGGSVWSANMERLAMRKKEGKLINLRRPVPTPPFGTCLERIVNANCWEENTYTSPWNGKRSAKTGFSYALHLLYALYFFCAHQHHWAVVVLGDGRDACVARDAVMASTYTFATNQIVATALGEKKNLRCSPRGRISFFTQPICLYNRLRCTAHCNTWFQKFFRFGVMHQSRAQYNTG